MQPKLAILIFLPFCLFSCKATKSTMQTDTIAEFESTTQRYVECINNRDEACLQQLIHQEYQGISPVTIPKNTKTFVADLIKNMEQNNFEVLINIKNIEMGMVNAFVTMDWQIKTKGSSELSVNVQRLDIWKRNLIGTWQLYRTLIYEEKFF